MVESVSTYNRAGRVHGVLPKNWQHAPRRTSIIIPEVAMHIFAAIEGKAAAIVHVQLALRAAAAVECHNLGPENTPQLSSVPDCCSAVHL